MNQKAAVADSTQKTTTITIKKYANRRLYNTATSSYVTLDNLATMVKAGADFVVYDAKSGEDITRSVLTHIIVEEESKGQKLLPVSFLRHLISFYGDSLQVLVPRYLEHTMQVFVRNQEQMRDYIRSTFGGIMPFGQLEEMSKQNIAIIESAMKVFSPFVSSDEESGPGREHISKKGTKSATTDNQIEDLRSRLNQMQKQLDELTGRQKAD